MIWGWLIDAVMGPIGAALAGVLAAAGAYLAGRKGGRQKAENDAMRRDRKQQEKGRDAVSDIRDASRDDLVDRVRGNDGRW